MVNNEIEFALNERFLLQKEYWGENKLINQIQPVVSVTVATYPVSYTHLTLPTN